MSEKEKSRFSLWIDKGSGTGDRIAICSDYRKMKEDEGWHHVADFYARSFKDAQNEVYYHWDLFFGDQPKEDL